MKLSKQERIAAIVVLVLVILVAGVFLFIKPNIETINATKATLEAKEREYNNAVDRVATKDSLRTQILAAYDKGKDLADMFFPQLAAYEADNEFRAFLETCEANVYIEDLEVSEPATASLGTSIFTPPNVQYALKDYVNQGSAAVEDPRLARQQMIRTALGDAQTIGASTVKFTVKAITQEDLLKFADEVNRYQKSENGKNIRKAIELSGVAIEYPLVNDIYKLLSDAILAEAEASAAGVFKDKTGFTLSGYENTTATTPSVTPGDIEGGITGEPGNTGNAGNANEEQNVSIVQYIYSMDCSITFYSIERMQDPTPTLDDQDKTASV